MMLSEYKCKELLAQFDVPLPKGGVAFSADEAESQCRALSGSTFAVKAQIGAGGRGAAGGVKFAATPSTVRAAAESMLGHPLVTAQTGTEGEVVAAVYVECALDVADEAYLALLLSPKTGQPTLLAAAHGGTDFEDRARRDPSTVASLTLTPKADVTGFLDGLGLTDAAGAAAIVAQLHDAFLAKDMLLLEVNPLARTKDGAWTALDAKIVFDGNAMFRHPELETLVADPTASPAERVAHENEINLVKLDGNIGVVVNGAGLGLATNDMLIAAGGRPANFMDIRTTATSFQIAKGVELLLEDPAVEVLLLNVHGGGMTVCDTVAEGVAFAYARAARKLPIVARLAGQSADWALKILADRRLPVETCATMGAAARRAVDHAEGRAH